MIGRFRAAQNWRYPMTQKQEDSKRRLRSAMGILAGVTVLFLIAAGAILSGITRVQQSENRQYLGEISTQCREVFEQRIRGDLSALTGVAVFIRDDIAQEEVVRTLEQENYKNDFLRMGYLDAHGIGTIVDINGSIYRDQDLSDEIFIHSALAGTPSVSPVLADRYADQKIICYAVPVYRADGTVRGVLTATNTLESFAQLVSQPLFGSAGTILLVQQDGTLILASDLGANVHTNFLTHNQFSADVAASLDQALAAHTQYTFSFVHEGQDYWGTVSYVGYNDWFLVGAVPSSILNHGFSRMIAVFIATILVLILLFTALLLLISHIRHDSARQIERLAYYDGVTGAYNANKFSARGMALLRQNRDYALVLLDLHDFKFINASFGFAVGNRLLCAVAALLARHLAPDEVYCRFHADQFSFLLHTQDMDEIVQRVTAIMSEISALHLLPNENYPIASRCGIVVNQTFSDRTDLALLQDRAALALKKVKELQGNQYAFYDDAMLLQARHKNDVEQQMHHALETGEFEAFLQPKYNLQTETVCSAEALVRWRRPDGTLVPPDDFIPIFEQDGFVTQLDLYVLESVCRYQRTWRDLGYPIVPISVNQSRLLFYQEDYLDRVRGIVEQYQIDPHCIMLEVTEGLAVHSIAEIEQVIGGLHEMGFGVSMDDFGSGYSSLNVLRELSIDELKLDRVFLAETEQPGRSEAILKHILRLARDLHITTVCEGVETAAQADMLRALGCDIAQGYYYSRPIEAQAFVRLAFAPDA